MGNVETMRRGDAQMTSGGTGIRHSEYNAHDSHVLLPLPRSWTECAARVYRKEVHFLQIWATPSERGLTPQYYTRYAASIASPRMTRNDRAGVGG